MTQKTYFSQLDLSHAENGNAARDQAVADKILREIQQRLSFFSEVGLPYLTLDRRADTLSGGEAQRIRLAAQLGSNLRGVCYILDEPTIGLHPRDNAMLLRTLRRLEQLGNSVLVVEHDEATIQSADLIIDLGPGAGVRGGNVVSIGTPEEIRNNPDSPTGAYLRSEKKRLGPKRELTKAGWLTIRGAKAHNLKNIDVKIPLGMWTCVTGISGSGKSTLVREVLYKGLKLHARPVCRPARTCTKKSPAGNPSSGSSKSIKRRSAKRRARCRPPTSVCSTRSASSTRSRPRRGCAAIRRAVSRSTSKAGAAKTCAGQGKIRKEMSFLPDVFIDCEDCAGERFNEETLSIRFNDKNIGDVFRMTVEEAVPVFHAFPKIARPLKILEDIGMGYITLGQASNTLSGGEAQRIKLAYELGKESHGKTLYVLDEPTTGLHFIDVEKLIQILHRLVDMGNTVITIEHNLDIVKDADYLIDLGPEGGAEGGRIVACGSPFEVAQDGKRSHTARFLREYLSNGLTHPARAESRQPAIA